MRVLFFVEGFTDIRFVVGLSEICELTVAVPAAAYRSSGLPIRVAASAPASSGTDSGGRAGYTAVGVVPGRMRPGSTSSAQELLRGRSTHRRRRRRCVPCHLQGI